jgi:hypothetical protein
LTIAILHSLIAVIASMLALRNSFENPDTGWFASGDTGFDAEGESVKIICLPRKLMELLVRRASDSIST